MIEKMREAFEFLAEKYEETSLKEITKVYKTINKNECTVIGRDIMRNISGFGSIYSCTLCKMAKETGVGCEGCYGSYIGCSQVGKNSKTYYDILEASTPQEIFDAIRNRAILIREFLKENN
jgi:hypothetical protein